MEKFEDNLTFEDIINQTLKKVKAEGMCACSGGIIGEDGKSHKIWDYLDLN